METSHQMYTVDIFHESGTLALVKTFGSKEAARHFILGLADMVKYSKIEDKNNETILTVKGKLRAKYCGTS